MLMCCTLCLNFQVDNSPLKEKYFYSGACAEEKAFQKNYFSPQ